MHMTSPTTFATYLATQLQREKYFRERDTSGDWLRATEIRDAIEAYVKKHAPRGSGFDSGTTIDIDRSTENRLVFNTSFHHMDEHGSYDGWTEHTVTVRPTFGGTPDIRISGRNRNGIKDHIAETFHYWLTTKTQHPALIEEA